MWQRQVEADDRDALPHLLGEQRRRKTRAAAEIESVTSGREREVSEDAPKLRSGELCESFQLARVGAVRCIPQESFRST